MVLKYIIKLPYSLQLALCFLQRHVQLLTDDRTPELNRTRNRRFQSSTANIEAHRSLSITWFKHSTSKQALKRVPTFTGAFFCDHHFEVETFRVQVTPTYQSTSLFFARRKIRLNIIVYIKIYMATVSIKITVFYFCIP